MCKPKIELVPSTSWLNNLRELLTKTSWDKLRKASYAKANHHCEICNGQGVFGRGHPVESHEIWSYDENTNIQKLEGLTSLCPLCHRVKHFGLSSLRGQGEQCKKHMQKVNEWSYSKTNQHISEAFSLHKKRSKKDWNLDISWLKDKDVKFKKKYSHLQSLI